MTSLLALVGLIPRNDAKQTKPREAAAPAVAASAGGCFWPQQEIFGELRGVQRVVAGYAGARPRTPPAPRWCRAAPGTPKPCRCTTTRGK